MEKQEKEKQGTVKTPDAALQKRSVTDLGMNNWKTTVLEDEQELQRAT
jgi:hypothetical protein